MKQLNLAVMMGTLILALASNALAQVSVDVSIDYSGGTPTYTTFGVYTDAEATVPIGAAIELDNSSFPITSDKCFLAGRIYVRVNEGNTGRWYVGAYTSNEVHSYWDGGEPFNQENASNLFIDETNERGTPLNRYLVWKYHNQILYGIYGYDSDGDMRDDTEFSIGHEISRNDFGGTGSFKFFVNIDPTPYDTNKNGSFEDLTDNEGLTQYMSIDEMLNTLKYASIAMYEDIIPDNNIIEIPIGVDTSTSNRLGVYKTTLNFEVYTR